MGRIDRNTKMSLSCVSVVLLLLAAPYAVLCDADDVNDSLTAVLDCVRQPDMANCMEQSSVRALQGFLDEAANGSSLSADDRRLAEELSDVLAPIVSEMENVEGSRTLEEEEKDEDDKENYENNDKEEGRGKKKKKKKALLKIFLGLLLVKKKLALLLGGLSTLLQTKFVILGALNLLLSLFRLYLEIIKSKQPQKVIYYEHAQHQHHYEHEHHYDDDHKGGWGLWGRSIAVGEEPYSSLRPRRLS